MSRFDIEVDGTILTFEIENGKILFPGYNIEDETIASIISNDEAQRRMITAWKGMQVLLDEIGIKEFSDQFNYAKIVWDQYNEYPGEYLLVNSSSREDLACFLGGVIFNDENIRMFRLQRVKNSALLKSLAHGNSLEAKKHLANNLHLTPEIIEYFSQDKRLRSILMSNDSTPESLRRKFVNDPDRGVRDSIALATKDADILEILSHDNDKGVVNYILLNKLTSAKTLERLSHNPDPLLLGKIMIHNSTPESLRRKFVNNSDKFVRTMIALATEDADILEILSHDKEASVLSTVVDNSHASAMTLERLSQYPELLVKIMTHKSTPDSLRLKFADHPNLNIRCAIAKNTKDPSLMKILMNDELSVRWYLAENAALPRSLRRELSLGEDKELAERAKTKLNMLEKAVLGVLQTKQKYSMKIKPKPTPSETGVEQEV